MLGTGDKIMTIMRMITGALKVPIAMITVTINMDMVIMMKIGMRRLKRLLMTKTNKGTLPPPLPPTSQQNVHVLTKILTRANPQPPVLLIRRWMT